MKNFVDAREWDQYHHPKELAISISLEAAELLEHFQWKEKDTVEAIMSNAELMDSLKNELADLIIYSLTFANKLGIDVSEAVRSKIEENTRKYPAELVKGKAEKYTDYKNEIL